MEKKLMNLELDDHLQRNNGFGTHVTFIKDTCEVHKGSRLDYLCVDLSQNFVFKCMYCVTDDNTNQLSLIPIEQIFISDSKTVFANFPLKDRDLTREIKRIVSSPPTGTLIKQSIDNYFKEFRAKFLDRIEQIQQKMNEKAQSISDFGDVLMSNYNRVSSKEHLKSIISDRQKPIENKSSELKEICSEALSKDEENKQLFTELINSMKTLEKATDFETPKLISESIMKQLESINMFLVDDIAQFQQQLLPMPNLQQAQLPSQDAISNLMKLVRNKLNDVSADSCTQLEQSLNRYSFVINQLPVPVTGPNYESFHKLNQEENHTFINLINEIANLKKDHKAERQDVEEEEEQKQMQENDRNNNNTQTEKLRANLITEYVSNRTNFCSNEFIEDISKVMVKVGGLLELFRVRKSQHKSEERNAFNSLNPKQLDDFAKLASQVSLFTKNFGDQYLLSQLPELEIQPNSNLLQSIINDHSLLKQCTTEEQTKIKKDLYQLFVKYPIAELLPPFPFFKPLPLAFTRTKYGNSSEMGITKNGNELELTFPNSAGKIGQVVSEKLKNESGYLLRLKFNRPYGKHGASGHFRIGLIPNSKIDSNCVLSHNSHGMCSSLNSGATILTRGGRLGAEPHRSVTSEVEFRWCISKRQFYFSDSNYENINQAEEKHFNPTENYHFGVCFYHIPEGDWKVTITNFQEIDPTLVPLFE